MPGLDAIVFLSPSSIGTAIEVTVADINSPTELNGIAASSGDVIIARTVGAATDQYTFYIADTTSDAQSLPWIVSSSTAGVKFIASAGHAVNNSVRFASTIRLNSLTASRLVTLDSSNDSATPSSVAVDQTITTTSTVSSKAIGAAGIALDKDSSIGDFTLSLSPANLTNTRRWTFSDRSDTVAGLTAQTFSGIQTFTLAPVMSALTASRLVRTDGSKALESNAALTSTHMLFADSNGWPSGSANLTWSGTQITISSAIADAINNTGGYTSTIAGNGFTHNVSTNGAAATLYQNSNANSGAYYSISLNSDTGRGFLQIYSSTFAGGASFQGSLAIGCTNSGSNVIFYSANAITLTNTAAGNVYIGRNANETGLTGAGGLKLESTTDSTAIGNGASINPGGHSVAKRSFLGTIGSTFKGNVLAGVQDATAASAGQVGEVLSSTVSGVAVAGSGTVGNVTSLSITAGDWLISGHVVISGGATGLTAASTQKLSIVTTTATNGTEGDTMMATTITALTANGKHALAIPQLRINISATTTYYLTEEVTYAGGSPTAAGKLIATRIR